MRILACSQRMRVRIWPKMRRDSHGKKHTNDDVVAYLRSSPLRHLALIIAVALPVLIGAERAEAALEIIVDKSTQRMAVIQDGYMRYIWPVSTGRDSHGTPNGVYKPQRLERSWFSTEYYRSPMPYSIFFHDGYAIHGSYAISQLGGPASHGCVRLHPHHAAILFDLVQQEGPENTTIVVADQFQPNPPPLPTREMDALVESVSLGDGGFPKGANPPMLRPVPYPDIGHMIESTSRQRGDIRPFAPSPALAPGRDATDGPDAASDQRADRRRFPARGASVPSPIPPPRRDPPDWAYPESSQRGDDRPFAARGAPGRSPRSALLPRPTDRMDWSGSQRSPFEARDAYPAGPQIAPGREGADLTEGAGLQRGNNRSAVTGNANCPCSTPPDESVGHRARRTAATEPPEEPAERSYGYKILPRPYWSGASWRWRSLSNQEAQ
jgi:hypothetical protein